MSTLRISDRVEQQFPDFIKSEDRQLIAFLQEYYKSQEKIGRPYNILNDLLKWLDVSTYTSDNLTSSTTVLQSVDLNSTEVVVEDINGYQETNGTLMVDNEIMYYESTTRGPDSILTPGIAPFEFDKKKQFLENPYFGFDGTRRRFPLTYLGTPVSAASADHLIVTVYGQTLRPGDDYTVDATDIVFTDPPRVPVGGDDEGFTSIVYLVGFADKVVVTMDEIPLSEWDQSKYYPLRVNGEAYTPISDVGLIVNRTGQLQRPFEQYNVYYDNLVMKYALGSSDTMHVRAVEFVPASFGSGASAVCNVENNQLTKVLVKQGGNGYRLEFAPRVTIQTDTTGEFACANSLVGGIKNINLIAGGQGYTSYNPPIPTVTAPTNPNGRQAQVSIEIDDATGQVTSINITDSGSGYDFIPVINFQNPGGGRITDATIDSEGRVNVDSIGITAPGVFYSNPPTIYIDPAPADGISAQAECSLDSNGGIATVTVTNRGRGYTTPPRCRVIDPVGAQVLDVTVASGAVTDIELLTGGRGYEDAPSVYIVDDRKDAYGNAVGGRGATAVATIFNGEITDINITNFGTGYSEQFPPKIFIAEPSAAKASVDVGYDEVTGFVIEESGRKYVPSSFNGVVRGVSSTVEYDDYGNQIFAKESQTRVSTHPVGSVVHNLDAIFIYQLFEKFRKQYLPTIELDPTKVNPTEVIKNIRDFYLAKGTALGAKFLFKVLFGEEVDISYPKDQIISPSAATWVVDTILRCQIVSGSAVNLIESEIVQYADEVDQDVKYASALVENAISIIKGEDTIYELVISEETLVGTFKIPYNTRLVEPLTTTDQIITVDSTIGWPERNGTFFISETEEVQYKEKSLNQFIECTRSKNGVVEDWDPGSLISSNIFIYANKGTSNEVKMRVLGIAEAAGTVLDDTGSYYLPGDKLNVAALGSDSPGEQRLESWFYNVKKLIQVDNIEPGGLLQIATVTTEQPHGLLVEDTVTIYGANPVIYNGTFQVSSRIDEYTFSYRIDTPSDIVPVGNILLSVDLNRGKSTEPAINRVVTEFTTNIQNSFFNNNFVYVAASGLPNYKIGPFTGSALIPGNQRKLVRIPRVVNTVSEREEIKPNTAIGAWVNGVSIWTYKSAEAILFGPLTGISVTNAGQDYDAGAPPVVLIEGGGGAGASATVTVNGSVSSFEVTNGGSGYETSPLISIVGGGGTGASGTAVVTNGVITRILVASPGSGFTSQPSITITGGGGTGATAIANIRGPIQSVTLTNAGSGYTSLPKVTVTSGEGALAQPIVLNGRIVSIATINSGRRYTTAPRVIINGDGFGAIAKATIATTGEDAGKVIGIEIVNRGINYTQGNTTVRLEAVGDFATFEAQVFEWNKNFEYELNSKYDVARGYVFTGLNNQYGGEYAHLSDPKELRYVVGDNVFLNAETNRFQELETNYKHSPILGWAYDGNPIYGPYGYGDPTDQNSGIRRLRTSYKLKDEIVYDALTNTNPARVDGPLLSDYPAGSFVPDYEYVFQSGDLDQYNGRFCKTPEYPDGTYAYFVTIDSSDAGIPQFPYILGGAFNSLPDSWNLSQGATQENIPTDVVRYRVPFVEVDIDVERQPNQESDVLTTENEGWPIIFEIQDSNQDGIIDALEQQELLEMTEEATLQIYDYFPKVSAESKVDIDIETVTQFETAQIDGFVIENPGQSYQVNDTIFFDNEGTGGFGASAIIDSIKGVAVTSYSKEIINDRPYGVITTSENHDLIAGDEIIVNSEPITANTNKTFKVKVVSGIEDVTVDIPGSGYTATIPPTYELISNNGKDGEFSINLRSDGVADSFNIINSGNGFDINDPPQIRVSHPQSFTKTRYWLSEYLNDGGTLQVHDSTITSKREYYVCGSLEETEDDDMLGILAKFDVNGDVLWVRTLLPNNAGVKRMEFVSLYVDDTEENDAIYVAGQTYDPNNAAFNPDIWFGKYISERDAQNAPTGTLQWQKSIAGISGPARRDFVSDIYLDQNKSIYLVGYTDTNALDAMDIWVIQSNNDGDIKEKRKIASSNGDERIDQIKWISDDRFFFTGVNFDTDNLIYGEFFFDGANIEVDYVKQIPPIGGGYVRNSKFEIDEYGDVFICWDVFNNANSKFERIQFGKFTLSDVNNANAWKFIKTMTPQGDYTSINATGFHVDIFGNVVITTTIDYAEDRKATTIHSLKFDGTLQYESIIETTDQVGSRNKTSVVDNSGDIIVINERLVPEQFAVFRFDDASDDDYDTTKRNIGTFSIAVPGDASIDEAIYKFGTGSLKFTAPNRLLYADIDSSALNWTVAGWFNMATAQYAAQNTTPIFFDITEIDSSTGCQVRINGINGDADQGKVELDINGTQVGVSAANTYYTEFGSSAWVHIAIVKENTAVGVWDFTVFVNGNPAITYQSLIDVNVGDIAVGGDSSQTSSLCFQGNIDDVVMSGKAEFTDANAFTLPTEQFEVTSVDSDIVMVKIDRQHSTSRGTYTLTEATNHVNLTISEFTAGTWTQVTTQPAVDQWDLGAGGLQLLDFSDAPSLYTTVQTYTWTNTKETLSSKSSTVPVKNGQKMFVTPNVIPKFYIKDAGYSKIDNIFEFTLNQDAKFTKGSILQQVNDSGVVQAYGTIVDVPTGTTTNPGLGTTYKIGKIFGTFDNGELLQSTEATDVNTMDGKFVGIEEEDLWVTATAYATGDRVYYGGRIYEAQAGGTSGVTPPTHTTGAVSDGSITWVFIRTAGQFTIDIQEEPYPLPQWLGSDMERWDEGVLYPVGYRVFWKRNVYEVAVAGTSGDTAPVHLTGDASDGGVTWTWISTEEALSDYARFLGFDAGANYQVKILDVQPASSYIPGDVVALSSANITIDDQGADKEKVLTISGFASVKKVELVCTLKKDIKRSSSALTDLIYATSLTPHNYVVNEVLYTEGFVADEFNGSFFVQEVFGSREFIFKIRDTATGAPTFDQGTIASVNIYAKHPTINFIRNHQYVFDVSDGTNFGYYLSFAQDNQYKLEYSFNNITRVGTPGVSGVSSQPYVKFSAIGNVTNISYYFDPSRVGADSPVGSNSFIDVIKTPFDGTFKISEVVSQTEFKFPLLVEPETTNAEVQDDENGNPYSYYSTTSVKAIGPINTIKLVSPGGFYQKLPVVSDIASFRQIERIEIIDGGTEYQPGVYYQVPIAGDGEGGLATITVTLDDETGSGAITSAQVSDPGKGYTTASIDVDGITGILGPTLAGSGAALSVIIPSEGSGASVFLTGKNIGKIKRLKNNEFGFGYSHDYTLRPEISFPVNLQLFNTSILTEIKITDPGAGYTSAPAVVISGGGGTGAEAVAVVKNNRLNEIQIKNPGSGYSSEPVVTLKSEFNYVINLDLNYLQFNFPHGITTAAEVQLRADDVGSTTGILPKPSSVGLTSLVEGQIYYAIADGLDSDQLRFALTPEAAAAGDYITFLTQGEGRQTLLTEVFGGRAEAVVATSRFLAGEKIYQGSSPELASATGYVSTNTGWQSGPKILKIVNYTGNFAVGEKINGEVSKASGIIDNLSIAKGVLNIDSLTSTPGRFTDDVGKPSEIIQKIQDSFFYQNFSYVISSEIPITKWKKQILDNNHPAGFKLFGQLQLTGGKDVSGRRVGTEFIKQVNINEYSNVNQITSFGAAEPVYTDYNNTEVLFRNKRLTSSEEILTSIVKKIDDISGRFDGIEKTFPITVEGEQVIVNSNQLVITLNGVIQAPQSAYSVVGGQIVFDEPPKAASQVKYRTIRVATVPVYRIQLTDPQGIFPTIGQQVTGDFSEAYATVVDSGTFHIDVINITDGPFEISELIKRTTLFSAIVESVTLLNTEGIYKFGESITNFEGDTALVETTNIDEDGNLTDELLVSKTSGTARFETGIFDLKLNEYIYSATSKIVAQIIYISPYLDPNNGQPVDTLIINQGSTFFGLIYERLVAIQNPNIILDDISQSSITPVSVTDSSARINEDFLDFEEVRSTEVEYENLTGGSFAKGDQLRNRSIFYGNVTTNASNRAYDAARLIRLNKDEIIDRAEREIAVVHPDFYYPGDIQTNTTSRYRDAYRLLIKNIDKIIHNAYDDLKTQYPATPSGDKDGYLSDLRLWVETVALDLHSGGNLYSLQWINEYFTDTNTVSYDRNTSELLYALGQAKAYCESAITNNYGGLWTAVNSSDQAVGYVDESITADVSPGDPYGTPGTNTDNNDPESCADVRAALTTIYTWQDEALTAGNLLDIPASTKPSFTPNQEKCRRDVGYFVDAIANDVASGGEFNSQFFAENYFDETGNYLLNGLYGEVPESLTALLKARDMMYYAMNNLLFVKDLAVLNDPASYGGTAPGYTYDANYSAGNNTSLTNCLDIQQTVRELTNIITTSLAAENTHNLTGAISYTSEGVGGPKIVGLYADPTTAGGNNGIDAADLLLKNKEFIAAEGLFVYKTANPGFSISTGNDNDCLDDIKDVIEAIAYDIRYGGNSRIYDAGTYSIAYDNSTATPTEVTNIYAEVATIAKECLKNSATAHTVSGLVGNTFSVAVPVVSLDPGDSFVYVGSGKVSTASATHNVMSATYDEVNGTLSITVDGTPAFSNGSSVILQHLHFTHAGGDYFYPRVAVTGVHGKKQFFDVSITPDQSLTPCNTETALVDSLLSIYTLSYTNGNMSHATRTAPTEVIITDGGYQSGEVIRVTKFAYKDAEGGNKIFFAGQTLRGITSNATTPIKGSNSGLKWIYGGNITGAFQNGELITNSSLESNNVSISNVIYNTNIQNNTSSYSFTSGGSPYIRQATRSYDFGFEDGSFTIEGYFRFNSLTGTITLVDNRLDVSDTSAGYLIVSNSGNTVSWMRNGTAVSETTSAGLVVDTWYHISVSKDSETSTTKLFIDGAEVSSDADNNNYGISQECHVGSNAGGGDNLDGYLDNFLVRKGYADRTAAFTSPTTTDFTRTGVVLGLNAQQGAVVGTGDVIATLSGTNISSATLGAVDYENKRITIEEIDLGNEIYRDSADIISANAAWIAEEAVGIMQAHYPDFVIPGDSAAAGSYGGTNICIRDTRDYIIPAIVQDLKEGGNYNVIVNARFYRNKGGDLKFIGSELLQTLYSWREVIKLCKYVINTASADLSGTYTTKLRIPHTLSGTTQVETRLDTLGDYIADELAPTGHRFRNAGDLIWKNRDYIAEETVGYIENLYTISLGGQTVNTLNIPDRNACIRDMKDYIIPALIADLQTGGNYQTQAAIDFYLNSDNEILFITDELQPMLEAFEFAKDLCMKAANNLLLGPGETAASNGAAALYQDEYYSAIYTSRSAYRDTTVTLDPEQFDQTRNQSDRYVDAANMIERNKHIIAKEAVGMMNDLSKFADFQVPGGRQNCVDDVVDILGALVHDLRFGGNAEIFEAGQLYIREDGFLSHIEGEEEATKTVFKFAKEMAILTIRNGFGRFNIDGHNDNSYTYESYERNGASDNRIAAARSIERNIRFIAEEAVLRGQAQYPSLVIPGGSENCMHDVADILYWMSWNLQNGGDNMMVTSAEYYVSSGNLQHITSQANESIWIFNTARDIAKQIYQGGNPTVSAGNTYSVTAISSAVSDTDVDDAVDALIQVLTDTVADPAGLNAQTYPKTVGGGYSGDLPNIWPCKYSGDLPIRDLTVTWDYSVGSTNQADWNQACGQQATAIDTLFDILIQGVDAGIAGNGLTYYGTTVTKTDGTYTAPTEYNQGSCYDVRQAIATIFDMYQTAFGAGTNSSKVDARLIHFNREAIKQRAYDQTVTFYPSYAGDADFADQVIDSVIYDIITRGNNAAFDKLSSWFDGDGNFIVYQNITRTHLIYHLTRIREYVKSIIYSPTSAGWQPYITTPGIYIPPNRPEWDQESTEFDMDSSINPFEFALERSIFPTEAKTTFVPSTDVVNLSTTYDEGFDWNTDPQLVVLTPTVPVGYDRAEFRVRINRANFFRRGDVVQYIPSSGSLLGGINQVYYYVLNADASFFEIGEFSTHDARYQSFALDTSDTNQHLFQVVVRSGVERETTTYGNPPTDTPYQGGFITADILYGTSSDVYGEIAAQSFNTAVVKETFTYIRVNNLTDPIISVFTNNERVYKDGDNTSIGTILQVNYYESNTYAILKVINKTGAAWVTGDVLVGEDSATEGTIELQTDRMLINVDLGDYANGDVIFKKADNTEADIVSYVNKSGAIISNESGRVVMDVETIQNSWESNDIIYGSLTDYILDLQGIYQPNGVIEVNDTIHGVSVIELDIAATFVESGLAATFRPGDEVTLLQGTVQKNPGFTATVTKYQPYDATTNPITPHKLWIANLQPVGLGETAAALNISGNNIGKFDVGTNFPSIYATVSNVTQTDYAAYGKVAAVEQSGITARVWLEQVVGEFYNNMSIRGDDGWSAAVTTASTLEGRVDRYFRGFDGVQTDFSLSIENGQAYFPDPAGHLLVFVNGILQPPNAAYTAFSDQIQFTEPPEVGSEFIGYYVGKLRQLDDISFEFDSLKSSFNLKLDGIFYSLTLTEGVSSATILPENNILISLNGIIQEPGVSYEIVGSRIIFSEVPRAGSTFVGFSYIGSDADVISATVVPPIETGDELNIEGEEFAREVALIESSNSLITFEYTGSVKGRNAEALADITLGQVISANITNPGDGYTSKPNVEVISSTGFDARVTPMMGISRIEVKSPGASYGAPLIAVQNTVEDDFVSPVGEPVNNGQDVYAGEATDYQGNPIVVEDGLVAILSSPVNVTVNQGQNAAFTVVAEFRRASDGAINTTTLNYQWQKKEYGQTAWTNIIGANASTFPTGVTTQQDDGDEYRVAITAAGATPVYSNSAILSVQIGTTIIANFSPAQIFDDA